MFSKAALALVGMSSVIARPGPADEVSVRLPHTQVECVVTTPNGIAAGEDHPDPDSYGNADVSVGPFGLWPNGTVVFKAWWCRFHHARRLTRNEVRMAARCSVNLRIADGEDIGPSE